MAYPYMMQGNNIVVVVGNKSFTVSKSAPNYKKLLSAIKESRWDDVKNLVDPVKVVIEYGNGNVAVKGDTVYWKDKKMDNSLSKRMIAMLTDEFSIEPLVNFMDNLMLNTSATAVNELYTFLEKNNLPITPEGHFLAYKKVRADYTDVHSGQCSNKPAYLMTEKEKEGYTSENGVTISVVNNETVLEMIRNTVDDDRNNTCSKGLHFCSQDYLNHFGGKKIVIVRVNPADVVSIPNDHDFSKGRTCKYTVIGELGVNPEDAFVAPVQTEAVSEKTFTADEVKTLVEKAIADLTKGK